MPVWLNLLETDEIFTLMFGREKTHGQTEFSENDEIFMALLSKEKPTYSTLPDDVRIEKVKTSEEFELWAKMTNDLLHGGYPDMHPVFHYPLCQNGLMNCYILYKNNISAAVSSIMNNNGVASLEFVATVPEMRRHGLAQSICAKAIDNTFSSGAEIITLRAINLTAAKLYQSLGFKSYNFEI